jgi:hypothetical protein
VEKKIFLLVPLKKALTCAFCPHLTLANLCGYLLLHLFSSASGGMKIFCPQNFEFFQRLLYLTSAAINLLAFLKIIGIHQHQHCGAAFLKSPTVQAQIITPMHFPEFRF